MQTTAVVVVVVVVVIALVYQTRPCTPWRENYEPAVPQCPLASDGYPYWYGGVCCSKPNGSGCNTEWIKESDGWKLRVKAAKQTTKTTATNTAATNTAATNTAATNTATNTATKSKPSGGKDIGKYVMTWYTFQGNTPCNSSTSSSGRKLIPYVSVAVPFTQLKEHGGPMDYGDQLYISFLDGRTMPNGSKHTGWVQVDDFCGDKGDDDYCYQRVKEGKFPNVDLFIGDWTVSGMSDKTCEGPAGSGQELINVILGPRAPPGKFITNYGGREKGTAKCGDCGAAKKQQKCWYYTPPSSTAKWCKDK